MAGPCRELGIGALLVQGDIACAAGDLPRLAAVVEHLSEHVAEPLHCELVALSQACTKPTGAATAWLLVKERLAHT